MKSLRSMGLACAACALLVPFASAHAEVSDGWYLGADAMMPFQINGDSSLPGNPNSEIEYKTGWGLSGSAGYGWGNGLRTEAELAYRHSAVKEIGPGTTADGGGIHNMALMVNALYDIETGTRLTPYIGAGIGGAHVDADNIRTVGTASTLDDGSYKFAYQAIAGAALKLEGNWSFTADYRYFATPDVKFKTAAGTKAETENSSHSILMGVRYQFEVPAAPMEPAPAPTFTKAPVPKMPHATPPVVKPIPQSYIVFFDFDKTALTAEAKKIIEAAARDYNEGKYVQLVVTGHADTSGSKAYNQRLSERRAKVVKEAFAAQGVAADQITVSGAGETSLRVPTTDGVREAQNRRAEIVLQR